MSSCVLYRLAFAVYLLTMILFWLVVRLGAIAMALLGVIMILANLFYGVIIINDPELVIPFNAEDKLDPTFGSSFYLSLFTGVFCIVIGCLIWALDFFAPHWTAVMFYHTAPQDNFYMEQTEDSASSFGVCRTEKGIAVLKQSPKKKRPSTRSTTSSRRSSQQSGSQNFMDNNPNIITLEDITEITEDITEEDITEITVQVD